MLVHNVILFCYLAPGWGCEALFSPSLSVCLSVCLCMCVCLRVRPIFWYFFFISQLLEEISIWNVYRILIGLYSIHWKNYLHRSMVKDTGTVHCFLKVQSYHKNWTIAKFQIFVIDTFLETLFYETIKTWASIEMTSQKYVNIWL